MSKQPYVASNGIVFTPREDGAVYWQSGPFVEGTVAAAVSAGLREFFQAERDEELGRWRDPVTPDYVVYPEGDNSALVVNETDGGSDRWFRSDHFDDLAATFSATGKVAQRYFAAHPTSEPKPWENPKPGEVWVLTIDGREFPAMVGGDGVSETFGKIVEPNDSRVTAGRRIWPEGGDVA